ncbi:histone-lysine N-methyltransferase PRDM9-like [Chrysoperla carnea]|uniref:histone-lysine N-methyltransferase PRDM9-like n=1 Tax=Chrysoperla carnea TaxID=189513 RepID=UPI001D0672C0|nr:histone-lysine N-methyltransferase PRDM9-like [Chrysoperla carnea]
MNDTNKECIDTSFDQEIHTLHEINNEPFEIITNTSDNHLKTVTVISDQQIVYSNYIPNTVSTFEIPITITETDSNKQISYATMTNVPFSDTSGKFIIHIESNDNYSTIMTAAEHESTSIPAIKEKKTYTCKKCNHFFTNRFDLIVHERIHEPLNTEFPCVHCLEKFTTKSKLISHKCKKKELNNTFNYVCETCNRKFKTLTLLNAHKRTHNIQNRSFICSICDKGFSLEMNLKAHINMHNGENKLLNRIISKTDKLFEVDTYPYKCRYNNCDLIFETKTSLQMHIKNVHK